MSNERYNQIIDDAYKNYYNKTKDLTFNDFEVKGNGIITITGFDVKSIDVYGTASGSISSAYFRPFTKEEFIDKCKIDNEFSEKWGLWIEERELSLEEQVDLALEWGHDSFDLDMAMCNSEDGLAEYGIPTRVLTVTYKKTIEIYE